MKALGDLIFVVIKFSYSVVVKINEKKKYENKIKTKFNFLIRKVGKLKWEIADGKDVQKEGLL